MITITGAELGLKVSGCMSEGCEQRIAAFELFALQIGVFERTMDAFAQFG
jgi:hypothetical protein